MFFGNLLHFELSLRAKLQLQTSVKADIITLVLREIPTGWRRNVRGEETKKGVTVNEFRTRGRFTRRPTRRTISSPSSRDESVTARADARGSATTGIVAFHRALSRSVIYR